MTLPSIVARTPATVVRVHGDDAARYLEDVTTQSVADLVTGDARAALVLEANGEPIAAYDIIAGDEHLLLVAPDDATAKHALETMASRTFLLDVTFEPTALAVIACRGTEPPEGPVVATIPRPHGVDLVTDEPDAFVGMEADPAAVDRLLADWDISHGVARWGHEIAPPNLPEEMGLLPSHVHLKKGCYPGQEAVARMWNLGRPRRRLAQVTIQGDVGEGAESGSGQDKVTVTGVVSSEPTIGMAWVGRDATVGDVHDLAGGTVTVTALVGDGLEVPGHDPAASRRRDQR